MIYKMPAYLHILAIGLFFLPLGAAHAGLILNVNSTAKEFYFTGSETGAPTSNHATWTADGTLLDVYMNNYGPKKFDAVKGVSSRANVGLSEAIGRIDNIPANIFFDRTPLQATGDLSHMRGLGGTVSPRIAASLGATSFTFAGTDGAAIKLYLADNGLMVDLDLSEGIAASIASSSSSNPTTSYASASPGQQAFLESLVDMSLSLLDGTGFGELQVESTTLVPEPTSAALLSLALLGLAGRRRQA